MAHRPDKHGRLWLDLNSLEIIGRKPARRRAPVSAAIMAERSKSGAALRKARELAAKHPKIDIEKEGPGAYWVTCDGAEDAGDDPLEGSHFCSDGSEVLSAVETYVQYLTR